MTNSKGASYNRAVISNHIHHLKSHKYGDKELAEMAQRLNAIDFSMGFQKVNTPEVLLSLSHWIKTQFGDIAMQEVALAFDLVTAKKIGNEIQHYNAFNKQYIGEVLNAFKTYRSQQIKLFEEHKKQKAITENQEKGASPVEMYEWIKKTALSTGKMPKLADWTGAFNYAWKHKLIHRMDEQERKAYKQGVISDLQMEGRANLHAKPIAEIIGNDNSLQRECHKRIMKVHFQELIDKNQTS